MPKVLKQLFHNRGRLLMRSIWNSDHIFSIFFCCERQDDGTVEKGPNRVFIRMPLNCTINVALSDAPIASISLVPLSLIVCPRVGSRNRCSRLKTLCKASLTLTSDITEIYRQARVSCSCASFEPVPEIVHEPAPGSTGGHNADPDRETHAFLIPLRVIISMFFGAPHSYSGETLGTRLSNSEESFS